MKFIHCFSQELKNKLLNTGYKIISEQNGLCIFENNAKLTFNFEQADKSQFIFTNKLSF